MGRFSKAKLRLLLLGLFFAIAIPSGVLVIHAQTQLQWEQIHQHQEQARLLSSRVESQLQQALNAEELRSVDDYQYLVPPLRSNLNLAQSSPLSAYPVRSALPGVIGYFQIDSRGGFSSPLLPDDAGFSRVTLPAHELQARQNLVNQLRGILLENQITRAQEEKPVIIRPQEEGLAKQEMMADEVASEVAVMEEREQKLSIKALENAKRVQSTDSRLQKAYDSLRQSADFAPQKTAPKPAAPERKKRKEQSFVGSVAQAPLPPAAEEKDDAQVKLFEAEVEPFRISQLASGHLVFFRNVWRNGERLVQGGIVDTPIFVRGILDNGVSHSALSAVSDVLVVYAGAVLHRQQASLRQGRGYASTPLRGKLLYQGRLGEPFADLRLEWVLQDIPSGLANTLLGWTSLVLAAVLLLGFWVLYHLGVRQIRLGQMQQDFISSVSHELKTPLTSIRMYADMLREGWGDEEKKRAYYDYIGDESERLSRLITNVLQLARLERNEQSLNLTTVSLGEVTDMVKSRVDSLTRNHGFAVNYQLDESQMSRKVSVDVDAFMQVLINLVDNAVKFSAKADQKQIDIAVVLDGEKAVWTVRDYGQGIAKNQLNKIFQLFYRSENELTRETTGTGIGLALVKQLLQAMQGEISVTNQQPGAAFSVTLPLQKDA